MRILKRIVEKKAKQYCCDIDVILLEKDGEIEAMKRERGGSD